MLYERLKLTVTFLLPVEFPLGSMYIKQTPTKGKLVAPEVGVGEFDFVADKQLVIFPAFFIFFLHYIFQCCNKSPTEFPALTMFVCVTYFLLYFVGLKTLSLTNILYIIFQRLDKF